MIRHFIYAGALAAAALFASPAFAQQHSQSAATRYAMIDDENQGDVYRDERRDERRDEGDRYHEGDHDRGDRYYDRADNIIRCESNDNRRAYCSAHGARWVSLQNQLSHSSCIKNRSWGYNGRGIWVDGGCRADFRIRS